MKNIAKPPLSKDVDDFFLRRKQEAIQNELLEFTKNQSSCDVRMRWERNTQRRMVSATISRHLQEAREQYQMDIDERRERLRELLSEERELFREMEAKKETVLERQAKMLERAKTLRDRRESERQRLVAEKLDQLFREQSEELRAVQMRRRQDEVCTERAAQIRTKEEVQWMQQEEDRLFAQMWESDRLAKEERHNQEVQWQRENNLQQKEFLQAQMETTEQQTIRAKQLKQEEAQLLREHREMLRVEAEREHRQKLQDQEKRLKQLNENMLKQAEPFKEREELDRILEENKLLDEEEKIRLREATQEYKADLLAQMLHHQRIHEAEQAEKEHEFQRGLWYQEQYNKKIQDILSRPISGTTAVHPFRRRERPCSNFGAQLA
ncbi:cilia- and flagella-associated protein 53-like [Sinocyclocheilus grahami]|uniref:cilia- and flagella-associated protein 53-like n=1 Tax=Sinocyclocheilus grahami TaxID=75366 RepID=UPI0007AD38FE|nr:PREDICTED: cilia- and flagella-associated protein 53-like [Sinocyclocheilus grahami]